jgi:DNA-binding winged helix-turn-helix (wHTH) protein
MTETLSDLRVRFGAFTLDTVGCTLTGPAGETQLSPLAARLVAELARTPGETVERTALISALWRDDPVLGDGALNRLVSEARQALGDSPKNPKLIQTVPRRGYRLVAGAGEPMPPLHEQMAGAANRVSYTKLAIIGGLILLFAVSAKVLMDTAIGVLWVANN